MDWFERNVDRACWVGIVAAIAAIAAMVAGVWL